MKNRLEFDGDTRDKVLDRILDGALEHVFPFLTKTNHANLAAQVVEHLQTHLSTELGIINHSLDEEPSAPAVCKLRAQFSQGKKHKQSK